MRERLESIKLEALNLINEANAPEKLNDVRVKFLGKKGELTAVLKGMKDVAPEDRPMVGQLVNDTRSAIEEALEVTNKQIIDELGGLPPVKVHCSVLADKAIKNAIYDYAQKNGKYYAALEGYDPNADEDDDHHDLGDEE